jgi:hypothetical protein
MKRLFFLFFAALSLSAATTTISQTILGADGKPASGSVSIVISSPCNAGTAGYVGAQPIRATITNGVFRVALVPNDACTLPGEALPGGTTYNVSWLVAGNAWKQTWYVTTATAPVTVDSVVIASPSSSGSSSGGGPSGTPVDQEVLGGTIDGTNVTFTLAHTPLANTIMVARNGLIQQAGGDYALSGTTVVFATAATPQAGDSLLAWYRY